jgi:hypothetical protein
MNLNHRNDLGRYLTEHNLLGSGVEVGTLYGDYAKIILDSWKGHLYCVDPWLRQDKSVYLDDANEKDLELVWNEANKKLKPYPNCALIRMYSLDAVGTFDDNSLDFVYLDGNHSYESVVEDITSWRPKIVKGGLLCGHDFYTRKDSATDSDVYNAVLDTISVRPHVTHCSSWWVTL